MKFLKTILFILLATSFSVVSAETTAEDEAAKLLNLMNYEALLNQSVAATLDMQLQQNPELMPFKDVMLAFLTKYMGLSSVGPGMIDLYVSYFTATELRELNAFYETDIGKKTIETLPTLQIEAIQLGAMLVEENAAELQSMMMEEMRRIQEM